MVRTAAVETRTYLPDSVLEDQLQALGARLEERAGELDQGLPAIVDADGRRTEIPPAMVDVLRQVVTALSDGMGVTVAPQSAMMTTQQAAEFLGISRPTLVRILERGDVPMERPGRHRYVRLSDLIAYQERLRRDRAEQLDELATEAEAADLYAATDAPPPQMR